MSEVIPAEAQTVGDFLCADFIIPTHGGSMAAGFSGTAEDARRIVDAITDRSKP